MNGLRLESVACWIWSRSMFCTPPRANTMVCVLLPKTVSFKKELGGEKGNIQDAVLAFWGLKHLRNTAVVFEGGEYQWQKAWDQNSFFSGVHYNPNCIMQQYLERVNYSTHHPWSVALGEAKKSKAQEWKMAWKCFNEQRSSTFKRSLLV